MPKWNTPKGKRQILIIGGLAVAGVLILVYFSNQNSSGSSKPASSTANAPTGSELSSSWNSSSTWSGASGNHSMRHRPFGGHMPPVKKSTTHWDADHDKKITSKRK